MADKQSERPSWIGKKPEEMTASERKEYEKSVTSRFTWNEGDLKFVGNEPLTEREKKLVEDLKKSEKEDK